MFLDFARHTARSRELASHSALARKIGREISAHLYEPISPTLIAERLNMNVSYLCRHFKQQTGKTISEYVNERKVQECKRLLETTDAPVSGIASRLGFSSQNYLYTVFKRVTGLTPMAYREIIH